MNRDAPSTPLALGDRYRREEGSVYLTGMQALVRLPIDQSRRDRKAGLRIGTFISGYPGSPLGGYDLALGQAGGLLPQHDILHVPGANEELAATAISGTQMLDHYPHSTVDGVVALWYGKGPGVDRSGDALHHGNFAGTSRNGAVVVLSGEDHEAKSSTMPHQQDYAFMGHAMPILYPASTGEFLTLGLHAIALSRYSGCWVAMKLVSQLADGGQIVEVGPHRPRLVRPELEIDGRPFQKSTDFRFFPGLTIETERRLYYERHQAVLAYARANSLDGIEVTGPSDAMGVITAGKSWADLKQALLDLGLDPPALHALGVRLLRMSLTYPVDARLVQGFARGLREIVVIEEKRGFLEAQVKEALYGAPFSPQIVGKSDENGSPLMPIHSGMDADVIASALGPRLLRLAQPHPELAGRIGRRLAAIAAVRDRAERSAEALSLAVGRTPNYCSGCPHNVSTRLLPGQLAWGSPGCHSFASVIEQPERQVVSMTQLGGEGLPWIGLAPYASRKHIVQNVGDGSLFHSSYLNIRFCVAAGVNITFKLLYNGVVANTGGQSPVGGKSIPDLTRLFEIEGVRRTAVVTETPAAYRRASLAANARVYGVDHQDEAMEQLAGTQGVTVFIYDGFCANERRRQQKRGKAKPPTRFVMINEEVCEGCGHCGALTNCMSLHRVNTEFGEKTRVHASSCNQDYSCLGGDCPAFVTVETAPGTGYRKPVPPALALEDLPPDHSQRVISRPYHIYAPGVGGTGVVTLNAILSWAALIDGLRALSYDQLGAAQKWGPVLSSLVVFPATQEAAANKVGLGQADLYLALDLLAAGTAANLSRCDPTRTNSVVNTSMLPSGEMVRDVHFAPPLRPLADAIASQTTREIIFVAARHLAEGLFGDHMATNLLVLGVAYQAGWLPLSATSIEKAIALNGVDADLNIQAFRYGRLWLVSPRRVEDLAGGGDAQSRLSETESQAALGPRDLQALAAELDRCRHLDEETRRLLSIRIRELIRYQDARYARGYVDFVLQTALRETHATPGRGEITREVARHLYKLMAYKDEYEVARLHTKDSLAVRVRGLFKAPTRVVFHLHPPALRALGLKKKLALGPWFVPALRILRGLRRLRGTAFDPFGYSAMRREERRLIRWYRDLIDAALACLEPETHSRVMELARLPDLIRGYEKLKSANAERVSTQAGALLTELRAGRQP
jgi:indolepyruvate ferredoxin oxidoreductase